MIPVNEPLIGKEELENVINCIKSGWISSKGSYITEFEERFSNYCGMKYGVTTTSGTTALHLAIESLHIGKGDEVIVPAFTMIATVYAIIYSGAKPVLVDSEPRTGNIDTEKIEDKITRNTKAILPVHIYGHPVDMDSILEMAEDHNLYVIEDAAEAHGAEYKGKKAGGMGDIGCFSFYANKIITTGEGGMIVTSGERIYERAMLLKDLAHSKEKRFLHNCLAFNYRMTNLQAAIGVAQLNRIDELIEIKRKNAMLYNKLLGEIKGIRLPIEEKWVKNVYWMYSILIEDDFGMTRDEVQTKLLEEGIETRTFFIPMHQQPVFRKMKLFNDDYPVAEDLSIRGLYLPSGMTLKEGEIRYVAQTLKNLEQ